jgi:hypothetical protein
MRFIMLTVVLAMVFATLATGCGSIHEGTRSDAGASDAGRSNTFDATPNAPDGAIGCVFGDNFGSCLFAP